MLQAMTQQQFEDYLDDLADKLTNGEISQLEYDDAVKDAAAGLKGYTQNLRNFTSQFKTNLITLGSAIAAGEEKASLYNQQINDGANVLQAFLQKFGIVGKLLGSLGVGLSKYATAVNEQADALYKSYQDISRNGLATGMDSTFKNLQQLGYTAAEVGKMSGLLKENANLLAQFGGTAAQGTKAFSDIAQGIQYSDIGYQFRLMGMNTDAINKGIVNYMKTQQQSGSLGKQTNEQIKASAEAYILQQDKMTKVTGLNADQQQSILDTAYANERFAAKQAQLRAKGDPESLAQAQRNEEQMAFWGSVSPKLAAGFADFTSGFLNSDLARKFNFEYGEYAKLYNQGTKDTQTLISAAQRDAKRSNENYGTIARYGMSSDILNDFVGTAKLSSMAASDLAGSAVDRAKQEQADQRAGKDAATKNMVDITTNQRNLTQTTDALTNKGIVPVTKGMAVVASGLDMFSGALDKLSGRTGHAGGSMTPAAATPSPPPAGEQQRNLASVAESSKSSGITDEKMIRALQSNVLKESGGIPQSEDLSKYANTSNERIRTIFGSRVKGLSDDELTKIKADPQKFAEQVYGANSGAGLGNKEPGDGWLYRGRGYIQLTGRSNYAAASQAIFNDSRLVDNPDLVNDPQVASQVAAWFIQRDKSRMASKLNIDMANMSQEQANLLVTSIIAGGDVRNKGAIGAEMSSKVAGFEQSLPKAAMGGILSGPKSGFQAMLHGTEAVVPLPDGRKIPVEMRGGGRSGEQIALLHEEVLKLENIVRVVERQNTLVNTMYQRMR